MTELAGKSISFKLEMAAEQRSQEGEYCIVWREDEGGDDVKSDKDGLNVMETKSFVEWLVLEQEVETKKHEKNVELGDDDIFGDVIQFPVPQFMTQYCQNFRVVAAFCWFFDRIFRCWSFFFNVTFDQSIE